MLLLTLSCDYKDHSSFCARNWTFVELNIEYHSMDNGSLTLQYWSVTPSHSDFNHVWLLLICYYFQFSSPVISGSVCWHNSTWLYRLLHVYYCIILHNIGIVVESIVIVCSPLLYCFYSLPSHNWASHYSHYHFRYLIYYLVQNYQFSHSSHNQFIQV